MGALTLNPDESAGAAPGFIFISLMQHERLDGFQLRGELRSLLGGQFPRLYIPEAVKESIAVGLPRFSGSTQK